VPKDPFTNEANWTLDQEDQANAVDQQEPGITDLHSSSSLTATDGTAYSSW
jgi:general secretion pathway protein G